ncbi:dihydroxy-acid dehydratase [Propionicimonas sp.]|uniref:dihydroxy-acid dehydratase n=1 Tax=Propionicimonas sp. TaxID=1955623 RepID=UPI0017D9B423|nr:dihydroxy-acid dehydratase [Propionicimonas sp.]MBU3977898.1 dihydroxy-acid dehydratase [Actinomycetota bacterium]MBA3021879.1 dihydroxy-acid dehydratase [Propionicimonas sp.]MBU3985342.1 dihydroxy-acid dehydratase [Actinomycetota bacterium]MBU4007397.1 dihydroxy-acid dehydratase [Actinomycetota bacterium]MBU4065657.1 dihydroxy-acid dehydratase [Actinomycetota bacterium]
MSPFKLRSAAWFDGDDEVAVLHRVAAGISADDRGRAVIGIADTSSALNPCQAGFAAIIPELERGIRDGGAVPLRFPVMSLGEDLMKPSAMLYRNLVAMELEEQVRAHPLDGVVYLANCDKTVPAALLAAASARLPALLLLGGSRSAPLFAGRRLGSGTDLWRALEDRRAGMLNDGEWQQLEQTLACAGGGSCNTMGTASTMALVTEALAMALPGSTGCQLGSPELAEIAYRTGRIIADAASTGGAGADEVMTAAAVNNALRLVAAVGGSTNAVIHLAAVSGRLGRNLDLAEVDRLWAEVPLLADVEPCGSQLAHDFHDAGGLATLAAEMLPAGLLDGAVRLASGQTMAELAKTAVTDQAVIRPVADPVLPAPTLVVVSGSLAPDGAVLKTAAASSHLWQHTGRAVVFDDYADMRTRLDDPELPVTAEDVLVVRNCGPVGVPGMPEWGMAPIPAALAAAGVRDMVRVSDGRMSGTSFGTVVLHVAPEAAVGGPLAVIADGDLICLDVAARRLDLLVETTELELRLASWQPQTNEHLRGWPKLYRDHVSQAPQGCDLDFLTSPTEESRRFVPPVVGRS